MKRFDQLKSLFSPKSVIADVFHRRGNGAKHFTSIINWTAKCFIIAKHSRLPIYTNMHHNLTSKMIYQLTVFSEEDKNWLFSVQLTHTYYFNIKS